MSKSKSFKKKHLVLIIVASVIVLSTLIGAGVYLVNAMLTDMENERIISLAAPLEAEKRNLKRRLDSFEQLIKDPISGGATMSVMALNINEEVFSLVWPIFVDASDVDGLETGSSRMAITGVLCLSPDELPGLEGKINDYQFGAMIGSGWSTAVKVSVSDADRLDTYLTEMKNTLVSRNIAMPKTAYFEIGAYDAGLDPVLISHGITSVVHTNSVDYDLIGTDLESDIWRVGMIGWSGIGGQSTNTFNSLLTGNGGVVFGIEIWYGERGAATHFVPGDSESPFRSMLGTFGAHVVSGELHIDSVESGRTHYENYLKSYDESEDSLAPEKQAIIDRIAEIDAELARIYGRTPA